MKRCSDYRPHKILEFYGNNYVIIFFYLQKGLKEELKIGEDAFAKLDEEKQAKERENEQRLMDLRRCVYFVYHYLFVLLRQK